MAIDLKTAESYARAIKILGERWKPHPKQIGPGRALFYDNKKQLFLCFGRQTGKSSLMMNFAVRWALTHSNQPIAIVGPYLNQTREIYLHSGQLAAMCPPEYLDGPINKTEGRANFTNGCNIKIFGADAPDTLRGLRFGLLLIDEIKDVKEEVLDIIRPTRLAYKAPLVIAGTPPEVAEHSFWDLVEVAKTSPEWAYFHATTYDNPYLDKADIDRERELYLARGDLDVFTREYLAEFAPGSKRAVFPMLSDSDHVKQYAYLRDQLYRNLYHWQFHTALDPGTASCFAGLVAAVNPYKGMVYVMDETYVTQQAENTVGKVWPSIARKMREVYDPDPSDEQWFVCADEAATWARAEILDQFGQNVFPTQKALHRKAEGISLIKDLLLKKRLFISDRCQNLLREMRGYMLDQAGGFIKRNDHAIDCLRYLLAAAHFTFNESDAPAPPEPIPEDERRRGFTPQEDWRELTGGPETYLLDQLD